VLGCDGRCWGPYEPDMDRMEEEIQWLLTPDIITSGARRPRELIGFCCSVRMRRWWRDYALDAVDVGLGCGRTWWARLAQEFSVRLTFGVARFAATPCGHRAADNQRSLRMFLRAVSTKRSVSSPTTTRRRICDSRAAGRPDA